MLQQGVMYILPEWYVLSLRVLLEMIITVVLCYTGTEVIMSSKVSSASERYYLSVPKSDGG